MHTQLPARFGFKLLQWGLSLNRLKPLLPQPELSSSGAQSKPLARQLINSVMGAPAAVRWPQAADPPLQTRRRSVTQTFHSIQCSSLQFATVLDNSGTSRFGRPMI